MRRDLPKSGVKQSDTRSRKRYNKHVVKTTYKIACITGHIEAQLLSWKDIREDDSCDERETSYNEFLEGIAIYLDHMY